jgi:hypothetical protein
MQPLGEVCVLSLSLSAMLFFSPLLSWQYLLQITCFFAHRTSCVVCITVYLFPLYIEMAFRSNDYEITSILPHGIHNVASCSAKSWFRFASPGWSTRLFSLPPGLSLRFVLPLYPRLNEDTIFSEARGKIMPKF